MKRILCLFLASMLIFSLVGCASQEPSVPIELPYCGSMTEKIRQNAMLSILYSLPGVGDPLQGDGRQVFDSRSNTEFYYIGTVQGYIVLLFEGNGIEMMQDYLGEEIFLHNQSADLFLYKNHTIYSLESEWFSGRLTDKKLFYKLAACLYQYQAANGCEEMYEHLGYADYADRYREALPSNTVPLTIQEKWNILYAYGTYNGLDVEKPGKKNQLFADAPYYYLGAYQDQYAVFWKNDYRGQGMALSIGKEYFCDFFSSSIRLYRDGGKIKLEDAYEQGLITDEDLHTLAKRFYLFQLENAEDPDAVRQLYGDYAARYEEGQ